MTMLSTSRLISISSMSAIVCSKRQHTSKRLNLVRNWRVRLRELMRNDCLPVQTGSTTIGVIHRFSSTSRTVSSRPRMIRGSDMRRTFKALSRLSIRMRRTLGAYPEAIQLFQACRLSIRCVPELYGPRFAAEQLWLDCNRCQASTEERGMGKG